MKKNKILVIDDEPDVLEMIVSSLEDVRFDVRSLLFSENVENELQSFKADLIVTDRNMSTLSGCELIKKLRESVQFTNIPIFMLTGQSELEAKLEAFDIGADEYLTKPFSPRELKARVSALLKRSVVMNSPPDRLFEIDSIGHRVMVSGEEINLTLTEFKILEVLHNNMAKNVSRAEITKSALGAQFVSSRTIDVHVTALRRKLGNLSKNIRTIRGVGYRFAV